MESTVADFEEFCAWCVHCGQHTQAGAVDIKALNTCCRIAAAGVTTYVRSTFNI
jgi:hypothetical protein